MKIGITFKKTFCVDKHLCFFSGKIPCHIAERLTARYWKPDLLHLLFKTVYHFSHYLRLYTLLAVAIREHLLFVTIRYSGFPDNLCDWHLSCIAYKLVIKNTLAVKSLTSWCDIQTGNFMFQCGLAEVKNNYMYIN